MQDEIVYFDDTITWQDTVNPRNQWTFRDNNNLRIPCTAEVIGTLNKSEAHKR